MNEVNVKQLIDQGQRTALLLGMITGNIAMLWQDIENGLHVELQSVSEALTVIHEHAMRKIQDIYYSHLEGVEHE